MKKLLLLPFLALVASCMEAKRDCKDFKTGKFKFEYTIDNQTKTTYFERNDSIEIETFEGKIDTATIRWVNDCEYILQKLHPKKMADKKAVSIRILTTKDNTYTFEFGIVGEAAKQKGMATKLTN